MKSVLAVIAGYLTMAVIVVAFLFGLYAVVGTSGAFLQGSYESSMVWNVASLVLGFVAALAGGWVCSAIAPNAKASYWLAGIVFVLGVLFAIPSFGAHPQEVRPDTLSGMDAMQKAYTPVWVALLNPVIGAIGVLLMRKKG